MAYQRPRRALTSAPRRRKRRRPSRGEQAWRAIQRVFHKGWVRALASLGMLTIWLRLTAQDFNASEYRTLGLQAMTTLVIAMLGGKDRQ